MSNTLKPFWVVVRINDTETRSLARAVSPIVMHDDFDEAHDEAKRLAELEPSAAGFAVLGSAVFVRKAPTTITEKIF